MFIGDDHVEEENVYIMEEDPGTWNDDLPSTKVAIEHIEAAYAA